jgi:hypothetical protein
MYEAAQPWAGIAAGWVALAGIGTMLLAFRGRRWQAMVVAAAGTVLVVECVVQAYDVLAPRQSGREIARIAAAQLTPATRLYSVRYYEQSVPFYLGRTLTLVDYVDEFETGQRSEPSLGIPKLADFPAEWQRPGDAVAIMHPETFKSLRESGLPMQVMHEDPRRVLVRKP